MKEDSDTDEINSPLFNEINIHPQTIAIESHSSTTSASFSAVDASSTRSNSTISSKVLGKMQDVCPIELRPMVDEPLANLIGKLSSQSIRLEDVDVKRDILLQVSSDKKTQYLLEVVFKAALVYFRSLEQSEVEAVEDPATDLMTAYNKYTVFRLLLSSDERELELSFLVTFRAMMKSALTFIPARRNKLLLIAICALLEGSGRSYITGGTQSPATSRRMIIFEQESGIRRTFHGGSSLVPAEEKNLTVKCSCGAIILKRSIWKHSQSIKHSLFTHRSSTSSDTTNAEP